jgi:hypothetical protein
MPRTLLLASLLLLPAMLPATETVKIDLVSLPAAKAVAVQRAKRAVGERPLNPHAMEAELLPDGQVRTRCAPALPDLRRRPAPPRREPLQ